MIVYQTQKKQQLVQDSLPERFFLGAASPREYLTKMQFQIVKAILNGATAKEVAQEIKCSYRTIQKHMENIRCNLDCHTRKQLYEKLIQSDLFYLIFQR